MEKFLINYQTGVVHEVEAKDFQEVKRIAEDGMAYTQSNVTIERNGEIVAISYWCPFPASYDDEVLRDFGDYGFYLEWFDMV